MCRIWALNATAILKAILDFSKCHKLIQSARQSYKPQTLPNILNTSRFETLGLLTGSHILEVQIVAK